MSGIDISDYKERVNPLSESGNKKKDFFDFLNKDISLGKPRFNDKKKEKFYSGLSILLSAGVDITTALELAEEQQSKKDKEIILKIKNAVLSGTGLSIAMEQTGLFSAFEFYSIRIGEESGKLPEVLSDLAKFYSGKIKQTRQVINALSYPFIVVLFAGGAIFFMIKFIVPMFADVFKRFKTDLPGITQLIIKASSAFSSYLPFIFLFLLLIAIIMITQKHKGWYRNYSSKLILKIPFIGTIIKKIYLARFCHSMNLLLGAKTPLINSLELVTKMVSFYPIEKSLEAIKADIMHGEFLHVGLSKFSFYDRRLISLVKVAEEVNKLDFIFEKLNKQYTEEVDYQTTLLSSILEPVIIVVLGLIVGVILVAMYLPLFKLSTSFGL